MFPDGRNPAPFAIPPHRAAIWVRERTSSAVARWPWFSERNDYAVDEPRKVTITGIKKTPLDTSELDGRLANLQDSDPGFKIAANPSTIMELTIDRGTLSAHSFPILGGMTAVRWIVDRDEKTPVRFQFDNDYIEIPADAVQVILANAGDPDEEALGHSPDSHFLLYRKLATEKTGALEYTAPAEAPQELGLIIREPTHRYVHMRTPFIDCSPVFSH
ncbi:MAG TPA: hypothetical protein VJZ00_20685 [Thermoanaerobaculia bacterium]|nr:hypothetical protein [Thermoanaerobaculia bacterium]